MQKIFKYIGIFLIIISLVLGLFAIYNKYNSDEIAVELLNETGRCFVGGTCLHEQSNINFAVLLGLALAIFSIGVGILIIYYLRYSKEKLSEKKKEDVRKHYLSSENKKIYDLVLESGGSMLQGELVAKSGMKKVKVSRILDKLEMQGIVERRRYGMSNIVVLKKKDRESGL